jgi:hypothetical protein
MSIKRHRLEDDVENCFGGRMLGQSFHDETSQNLCHSVSLCFFGCLVRWKKKEKETSRKHVPRTVSSVNSVVNHCDLHGNLDMKFDPEFEV